MSIQGSNNKVSIPEIAKTKFLIPKTSEDTQCAYVDKLGDAAVVNVTAAPRHQSDCVLGHPQIVGVVKQS